uniref:SPX domain-containing protein n=1 Tax=Chlamydomonas euryale TaxID=1486919 RepID=A0A7R9VSK2_9CHLO|mmetsp:Transcript_44041/g.132025  ORF Transcript_44041/g.132025 Transcript_44041/m.132025 type:complete len:216 (+) Transcript_44041:285-932(+)
MRVAAADHLYSCGVPSPSCSALLCSHQAQVGEASVRDSLAGPLGPTTQRGAAGAGSRHAGAACSPKHNANPGPGGNQGGQGVRRRRPKQNKSALRARGEGGSEGSAAVVASGPPRTSRGVMKFGKRLAAEAARRWCTFYFDYKAIKKAIKDDIDAQDASGTNFQSVLVSELQKVSQFYTDKATQLDETLSKLQASDAGGAGTGEQLRLLRVEVQG